MVRPIFSFAKKPNLKFLSRKSTITDTKPKNPFDKEGKRDRVKLKKYVGFYRNGGLLTQAINAYALAILSNGYRIECDDEIVKERVEEFLHQIYFEEVAEQAIKDSLITGDGFQEISYGKGGESGTILEVLPRDASSFDILHNEYGDIQGYRQFSDESFGLQEKYVDLAPYEIVHTNFNVIGGSPYGLGLIQTAYDDIVRDCKISESIEQAIIRHGFPKYKVTVGKEGEQIPKEVMTSIESQFRDIQTKNEWILSSEMDMQMIDNVPLGDIQGYGEWSIDRLTAALSVPSEMLGLGRGSTEATAKVRMEFFYDNVSAMQKRLANSYNRQLIDRFTGSAGLAKIIFEDANTEDDNAIYDRASKIMMATPMDPYSTVSRDELREKMGFEPDEEPELEELPDE